MRHTSEARWREREKYRGRTARATGLNGTRAARQAPAGVFCFGYRLPKNFLRASAAASFEFVLFAALASGGSPAGWDRAAINASIPEEAADADTDESPAATTGSAPTGTELTDEASPFWPAL